MNDSSRLEQLRAIPMLAGLPDDALMLLAERATDFEAPAGHVLVQANEPGSGVLILASGRATVELGQKSIEAGECIGELALLLDDVVHVARVRAATDVRGIAISRRDFTELLATDADIAGALLRVLARRLVAADGMLAVGP
jgi:CRP/FNR family transcriptional regulator, cyclic AMP receptor protein